MMKQLCSITQWPRWRKLYNDSDIDQILNNFLSEKEIAKQDEFKPATNIKETEKYYLISSDIPGVNESDIHIQVENDCCLSISGRREAEKHKEDKGSTYFEKSYGEFYRSFQLSPSIDKENIQARYENGVLEVLVPKKNEGTPIKIEANKGKTKEVFKKYLEN